MYNAQHGQHTLKESDTFGNCQRPVFSLGASQHMHTNKPVKTFPQLVIEVARK